MSAINTIADVQSRLVAGFDDWAAHGHVNVRAYGPLRLFTYTPLAQYEGRWTFLERVSRGLLLHAATGEVIARPFDKFFNWGEGGRTSDAPVVEAVEKLDGSLGIGYFWDGRWQVTTRGSLDSEQGAWATAFLNEQHDMKGWPREWTPLWEIIYPGNRIVVDYGRRRALVLIGARHRATGTNLPLVPDVAGLADRFGFPLPRRLDFTDLAAVLAAREGLTFSEEGFVLRFADGQRFKFKGDSYLAAHRLMTNTSFKAVLRAVAAGQLSPMLGAVPDEFHGPVRAWEQRIAARVAEMRGEIETRFAAAPTTDDRRAFAAWVTTHHKRWAPYLFARLDGKPLDPLIYKMGFDDLLADPPDG